MVIFCKPAWPGYVIIVSSYLGGSVDIVCEGIIVMQCRYVCKYVVGL